MDQRCEVRLGEMRTGVKVTMVTNGGAVAKKEYRPVRQKKFFRLIALNSFKTFPQKKTHKKLLLFVSTAPNRSLTLRPSHSSFLLLSFSFFHNYFVFIYNFFFHSFSSLFRSAALFSSSFVSFFFSFSALSKKLYYLCILIFWLIYTVYTLSEVHSRWPWMRPMATTQNNEPTKILFFCSLPSSFRSAFFFLIQLVYEWNEIPCPLFCFCCCWCGGFCHFSPNTVERKRM